MSWSKTVIINANQEHEKFAEDIEQRLNVAEIVQTQPNATPAQINAGIAAAKALMYGVHIPDGHNLRVSLSGHCQAKDTGSMPDSITASVSVTMQLA